MTRGKSSSASKTGVDRWNTTEAGPSTRRGPRRPPRSGGGRARTPQVRRYQFTLLALAIMLVACAIGFMPPSERVTQGLDIRGGVSVILSATKTDGSAPSADDMAVATAIVQNRVNALGASETSVQQQGTNSILVQIPGATDADAAIKTIGQTGHLEFVRLDAIGDADALAKIGAGTQGVRLKEGTYTPFMDGSSITSSAVAQASAQATGAYAVNVSLDKDGAREFAEVTAELAPTHGQIAIVLDGVVNSAPAVQSVISDGNVSITGNFSLDEAKALKTVLDSGSLPVTLSYSESRVVGPTLGQDSLRQGMAAIGAGAVIVIAYLFFFYQGLGLLTMGSLAVFGVVYLGLLALLSRMGAFALTLPGLAGVVLTTGSAADSSILVLERFREEVRMGRSVRNAAIGGTKEGIGTSLDADAVQLVTALALFLMAVGPVKGFGLTTALGILCDVVTMFLFKGPALRLLAQGTIQRHPKFWGIASDLAEAAERKGAGAAADDPAEKGGVAHA
ncbi:MAG: protein translocase subunit SecD [Acidobacteriota bacterium]|nr:protein translocase subunit SecD [Acidobacteriota bacterium]